VLGVFVEIAGTEQMATASFHVIRFHLPRWLSGSRCQEDNHTQGEKTYLLPVSHNAPPSLRKASEEAWLSLVRKGFYSGLPAFAMASPPRQAAPSPERLRYTRPKNLTAIFTFS
jgi:hypothetical protein